MAISFHWQIKSLKVEKSNGVQEDVVCNIDWDLLAIDEADGLLFETTGKTKLPPPPEGSNFTPFESLTEEQVIGWLESQLSIDSLKQSLLDKHAEVREPKIIEKPAPWLSKE